MDELVVGEIDVKVRGVGSSWEVTSIPTLLSTRFRTITSRFFVGKRASSSRAELDHVLANFPWLLPVVVA